MRRVGGVVRTKLFYGSVPIQWFVDSREMHDHHTTIRHIDLDVYQFERTCTVENAPED